MSESTLFPRTQIDGLSVSRLVIGTNWLLGFSHRTEAASQMIEERNGTPEACCKVLEAFLSHGVDTLIAPLDNCDLLWSAMRMAEERSGKRIIKIDTSTFNVDDSPMARAEAKATIRHAKELGVDVFMFAYATIEQLVNKNTHTIERIGDYTDMIREAGMIPGTSGHMPEVLLYCDENEYDIQSYVQIFNGAGFMMQYEVETIYQNILSAKKPVLTIKPLAAGRMTPFVGLNFAWNVLRPQAMVAIGCVSPNEAHEDVEYSLAALERRPPVIRVELSPARAKLVGGFRPEVDKE